MDQITISNTGVAFLQHSLFTVPYLNPFVLILLIWNTLKTLALLPNNHSFVRRI